jgi:hypothetical protein
MDLHDYVSVFMIILCWFTEHYCCHGGLCPKLRYHTTPVDTNSIFSLKKLKIAYNIDTA